MRPHSLQVLQSPGGKIVYDSDALAVPQQAFDQV
jgi:hypothetical protein